MIKNDKWIREQAVKGMITPFEPQLVRKVILPQPAVNPLEHNNFAGSLESHVRKVISYGCSSYGYDLRLSATDFRIFRHIPGTIINPKAFNPDNLDQAKLHTDEYGDYFIIPANSYGLGVALEKLEIPSEITVIFIGKCLTEDTRILNTLTGEYAPIKDFCGGEVASFKDGLGIIRQCGTEAIYQGIKPVFSLQTSRKYSIKATSNHPFLTPSGWKSLEELKTGDLIATPKALPFFGTENVSLDEAVLLGLMISEGQCDTPNHSPTFTTEDLVLVELLEKTVKSVTNQLISKKGNYGYRLVNQLGRGGIVTKNRASLWLQSHKLNVGACEKFVPQSIFKAPKQVIAYFLRALFSGDGSVYMRKQTVKGKTYPNFVVEYASSSKRLIEDVRHLLLRFGIPTRMYIKHPKNGKTAYILMILDAVSQLKFFAEIGFWKDSLKQKRFEENFSTILDKVKGRESKDPNIIWDKVTSITPLAEEPVYDISVPSTENFVANDLIVHNSTYARCGIIANLTPGEAGWKGYLTLEFSNASSADCRIYANEGVVQALFLEGEPCETTYDDRQGKYQDQSNTVTLAKV